MSVERGWPDVKQSTTLRRQVTSQLFSITEGWELFRIVASIVRDVQPLINNSITTNLFRDNFYSELLIYYLSPDYTNTTLTCLEITEPCERAFTEPAIHTREKWPVYFPINLFFWFKANLAEGFEVLICYRKLSLRYDWSIDHQLTKGCFTSSRGKTIRLPLLHGGCP